MRYSRPGPSHTGPWQAMLKIVIFILKAVGSHYRNLRRVECSDFLLVSITYAALQRMGCRGREWMRALLVVSCRVQRRLRVARRSAGIGKALRRWSWRDLVTDLEKDLKRVMPRVNPRLRLMHLEGQDECRSPRCVGKMMSSFGMSGEDGHKQLAKWIHFYEDFVEDKSTRLWPRRGYGFHGPGCDFLGIAYDDSHWWGCKKTGTWQM